MKDELSASFKGWSTVCGGFLIHIVLGSLYCWANLTSAITSRLRLFHPDLAYSDTLIVFAAALAAQGLTIFIGGVLAQNIGTPITCLIGGYILVLGTYLSSFVKSLDQLILTDGVLFGIGLGICYTSPISCAVRWLPTRKGLVTGIIVGGFGCGAFFFGNFATFLVNPHNKAVEQVGPSARYYSPDSEVVERVPYMFEMLALTYFFCISIGCLLLFDPSTPNGFNWRWFCCQLPSSRPMATTAKVSHSRYQVANTTEDDVFRANLSSHEKKSDDPAEVNGYRVIEMTPNPVRHLPDNSLEISSHGSNPMPSAISPLSPSKLTRASYDEESSVVVPSSSRAVADAGPQDAEHQLSPQQLLELPVFWHLTSCFVTTTVGGMYIAGTFKTFGQQSFNSEAFLASISSISAIFNAVGRIAWGSLADRIGPLQTLYILSFLFSIILATYALSPLLGEAGFVLWTFALFFFEGGNFVLYVPIAVQLFGSKFAASNYGLIFSVYSIFVVLNITVLSDYKFEFALASRLMAALTFIGFINLLFFGRRMAALKRTDGQMSDCKFT